MTTTSPDSALQDALDYLRNLSLDRVRPAEALGRLRHLRQRHPQTSLDVVWEAEAYDEAVHYDVLLRSDESGTVSLGYAPERAQPWPLRGVHRWSDQELLRVNHTSLPVSQAVACLDFVWDQAPLVDRLVNVCLIQEELEREPIDLSDAELQLAMDGFRRARRLRTAQETLAWMQRRGITHVELEALVGDEAVVAKLRRRIATDRVEPYFQAHQADFETVHIARVAFATEDGALAAIALARTSVLDFFRVAQSVFVTSPLQRPPAASFETIQRYSATAPAADILLAAKPGDVVGPVLAGDAHILALILSHTPAQLDAPTRAAIESLLFTHWLEERRAHADIEWFWWNAARTRSDRPAAVE